MSLQTDLNGLYALHTLCSNFDHAIRKPGGDWEPYKPSVFIHAYFAFNTIYSSNWQVSFQKNALKSHGKNVGYENEKFEKLLKFCYSTVVDTSNVFIQLTQEFFQNYNLQNLQNELANITIDHRTDKYRSDFDISFSKIFNPVLLWSEQDHMNLLQFIYMVRNNIFHGSKPIPEMMQPAQQTRLMIYSVLLFATNELFFLAAEQHNWQKPIN